MHTKHVKINVIRFQKINSILNYCPLICSASLTNEKRKDMAETNF